MLPRVYPILDTAALARRGCPPEQAAAAWVEGGARILQYRHKSHWTRSVFEEARRVAALCRDAGARFLVDDRADMAALLEAGLHVGQNDLAPGDARRIVGAQAVLGLSTHNVDQLRAAAREPVTYVAFGPIFATASKENPDPVAGLEQLRICRCMTGKPLVGIGGITRENARAVWAAGADSVAVIGDMIPDDCSGASLRARMEEWQQLAKR